MVYMYHSFLIHSSADGHLDLLPCPGYYKQCPLGKDQVKYLAILSLNFIKKKKSAWLAQQQRYLKLLY